jgi:PRTRC genetic system protein E
MITQIATILAEKENVTLNIEKTNDSELMVIVGFKPKTIPTTNKADLKEQVDSLNIIRAELAKPRVLKGTPEDIESQLTDLCELKESNAYKEAESFLDKGITSIEEAMKKATAVKKTAKTPATKTPTTKTSKTPTDKTVVKKEVKAKTVTTNKDVKEKVLVVKEAESKTTNPDQFDLMMESM